MNVNDLGKAFGVGLTLGAVKTCEIKCPTKLKRLIIGKRGKTIKVIKKKIPKSLSLVFVIVNRKFCQKLVRREYGTTRQLVASSCLKLLDLLE